MKLIYYPILVLGIIAAGCVFTGTNPGYTPLELEHHLRASRAQMIICEPELLSPILATSVGTDLLAEHHAAGTPRILIFDHHIHPSTPNHSPHQSGYASWRTLLRPGVSRPWQRIDSLAVASTTTAMLLFSSGTSGLPKPVSLTHTNLIAQHDLAIAYTSPAGDPHTTSQPPWRPIRRLSFLPAFHAATVPNVHVSPIRSGEVTYVLPRFAVEPVLRSIARFQITDTVIVPPCVLAVVNAPPALLADPACSLSSLRWARVGAAPLGKDVQARFQALLDRKIEDGGTGGTGWLTQIWGMTETSCLALQFAPGEGDASGSVGRPIAGLDVKVVDDEGKEVVEEVVGVEGRTVIRGELCVRGPTVVPGYVDELIKVRGFQVAPPEIEAVLLAHPDVLDAAVIGVFDNTTQSELPRAYIVKRETSSEQQTRESVKKWVSQRLAKYKCLEGGVVFMEAIPKTASGKILKRVLRDMAKTEMGRESKL
ncbi:putative amp-binding enzyme protein [Neofusicoccum parvum UCRNP2]|uniref:Putative amp-binding enzyme protein n=1 Tax=Botryosphaeria parva (strain UCR-NP2) TaxID=1287680 RepID=R1FWV7_BOTPV|nr:putative amp-binding enzyme protein [Neofusicoccum parvum UCRNP2]